jgi:hypothetical protein
VVRRHLRLVAQALLEFHPTLTVLLLSALAAVAVKAIQLRQVVALAVAVMAWLAQILVDLERPIPVAAAAVLVLLAALAALES